jgi:beta-N-acetylhexosaminidase
MSAPKVGKLFMFGFEGTEVTQEARALVQDMEAGALILFASNCDTPAQVRELTASLQHLAAETHRSPLLIAIDQEGGAVQRILSPATEWPGNMALGAAGDEQLASRVGEAIARELLAMGINLNIAPVVDVNNNPDNPIIGIRSFGADPNRVAALGAAFIQGMQNGGVAACAKHFPGHGDTAQDSHITLPSVPHDLARLWRVELPPFDAAAHAGVASIMTAHVTFPALEPEPGLPATLSRRVITGLLRNEMRFRGLIVADALEMAAVADRFGVPQAAVRALQAGADMVPVCSGFERQKDAFEAVSRACAEGRVPGDCVDRSAPCRAKVLLSSLSAPRPDLDVVGCAQHRALAQEVATRSVTLVRNRARLVPLALSPGENVLAVWFKRLPRTPVSQEERAAAGLSDSLREHHALVSTMSVEIDPTREEIAACLNQARKASAVVIGTLDAHLHPSQAELVNALHREARKLVVVAAGYPADLRFFPQVDAYLACYCWRKVCLEAAAAVIFGKSEARGCLPVEIPGVQE